MKFRIVLLFSIIACCSCEYKNVALEYAPVIPCDTSSISYRSTIVPILRDNCYVCHSTAATSGLGGLDLENYYSFRNYLNNYFKLDGVFGSAFYHSIIKSPGILSMPPGNTKLSDCEILKIKVWINQGALNN